MAWFRLCRCLSWLWCLPLWSPQLHQWEERLASRTWSLASPDATERRVVVVDIDEKSTQALGPWPWPRERVATLLTALDAYNVNLKVVDVLFEGAQDPAQDQKLAQALKAGAPTVISQLFALSPQAQLKSGQLASAMGACPAKSEANAGNLPFGTPAFGFMGAETMFAQSSAGVGHITPIVDSDGSIRRVPAVVCYEGQAYPALAVASLAAATGAQPVWRNTQAGLFSAGSAQILDVGGLQLPLDASGQLRVSYQMPREGFAAVSAVDVLQGKVPPSMLKGAWVLVGSTAFGGGDAVPTPQGGAVGGVEVHAQLIVGSARCPHAICARLGPAMAFGHRPAGFAASWCLSLRAAGPKAACGHACGGRGHSRRYFWRSCCFVVRLASVVGLGSACGVCGFGRHAANRF